MRLTAVHGESNQGAARPRYRPIGDYGVIGDCRTAALIGPDGSIDWCCMPHFDSPAIFLRLLDADKGGYFSVCPTGSFTSQMAYLPATNMLQTIFTTETGKLRLVDCMPIRARRTATSSAAAHVRAHLLRDAHGLRAGLERELGNDVAAAHRILRVVTCLEGSVDVDIALKATFDYARRTPDAQLTSLGNGIVGAVLSAGDRFLALVIRRIPPHTSPDEIALTRDGEGVLRTNFTLTGGGRVAISLNYARTLGEAQTLMHRLTTHDVDADLDETLHYWHNWAAISRYDGPYQEEVQRSALALKLCTFEPTGAIVAAPTTSLPEGIGGVRNWDYRYTWLRDSAFTLGALGQLGYNGEARDYFHFLHDLDIKNVANMRIMYSIRGEYGAQLAEQELAHLEGYRRSTPVRIGNGAALQRQMDVYGEVLDAAYSYIRQSGYRHGHRIGEPNRDLREMASQIADYVAQHWHDVDSGIWEVRGAPRAFVYSRAMCWVALDRACRMADRHGHTQHAQRWTKQREAIRAEIETKGYDADLQSFTQSYGDKLLDAANLRLALVHFQQAHQPQMRSTILATGKYLSGDGGLLYRYRAENAPDGTQAQHDQSSIDGLPGGEGAFLACTWWLLGGLCRLGQVDEAQRRFEHLLTYASPLGLYSEEVDPASGALLGNYPQAFTHIGLINSAITLQRAQEGRLTDNIDDALTVG